jgi:hypothetical protein
MAASNVDSPTWPLEFAILRRVASLGATLVSELAVRPAIEFGQLILDRVWWGADVPRGDGHAILTLPGLFAGDSSLILLRDWLRRMGYTPVPSGLETNPGWSEELVWELCALTDRAHASSGRPITIIGQSLGGVLAWSVALRRPDAVRHVITLGSPLAMTRGQLPTSVQITAIYSLTDPVVRHPSALAREPHARNIEVDSSHVGLGINAATYRHLAAILPAPGS